MDWGRAKSVLIMSFLMLNIVLAYQLWMDRSERMNVNVDLTVLTSETLRVMQEKGIRLTGSIPSETPSLGELTYRYLMKPGSGDKIRLESPIDSRIVYAESELEIQEQLGGIVPDIELYRFDAVQNRDGVFIFYRKNVDKLPMFDVKLELYYSNQKITDYTQSRVETIDNGAGELQPVLPAAKAVANLIENRLPEGSVIMDIRLGYHGQIFNTELQVASPSWRVLLEDGGTYYVNAISGEVVTDVEVSELTSS